MTTELKLFVYVIGSGSSSFSVTLQNSKTVDDLKNAIKEKKKPELDHIAADRLTLFKVDQFPSGPGLAERAEEELDKIKERQQPELDPASQVSKHFGVDTQKPEIVHVLVEISDIDGHVSKKARLEGGPAIYIPDQSALSKRATELSWSLPFQGNSAALFIENMNECLLEISAYAHFIPVVQSSGTGKSRMIDEVSKKVLVLRMNLRDHPSGFPPCDEKVRNYFTELSLGKEDTLIRIHAFLTALFTHTLLELRQIIAQELPSDSQPSISQLAELFRKKMCDGQTFELHNPWRRKFYQDVVNEAEGMVPSPSTPAQYPVPRSRSPDVQLFTKGGEARSLDNAALHLIDFINQLSVDDPNPPNHVKLLLEFDEAHVLTKAKPGDSWSPFTELRRALRTFRAHPIFSTFLSTAGKVGLLATPAPLDFSARIHESLLLLHKPYTALGFDHLAQKVISGQRTIDEVIAPSFFVMMSRPLFSGRYLKGDAKTQDEIVDFALQKLIGVADITPDEHGEFACLAVRLPLEFNATTRSAIERERTQIERHLRICLGITQGNERLVSIAPSEPVLVEAAIRAMSHFDVPRSLLLHLEKPGLAKGDRGELVGMLLLLLARDKMHRGAAPLPTIALLQHLLHASHHETILRCLPTDGHITHHSAPLSEMFKDSYCHFTHFIKVNDYKVIDRRFLWRMMIRGAAILCADNQRGVDVIIPCCLQGKDIREENMVPILLQFKNDPTVGSYNQFLFDLMDPVRLQILSDYNIPVIRMVVSLAASRSGVQVAAVPARTNAGRGAKAATLTSRCSWAYDIFAGNASCHTFAPIGYGLDVTYQDLLKASRLSDAYEMNGRSESAKGICRNMHPGAGRDKHHWSMFAPIDDDGAV